MKITLERASVQEAHFPRVSLDSPHPSDLSHKSTSTRKWPRRRINNSSVGVLLKRGVGIPSAKRGSHPETPMQRWKLDAINGENDSVVEDKSSLDAGLRSCRKGRAVVSARKLAAEIWRLHLPEYPSHGGHSLGVQPRDGRVHHVDAVHRPRDKDLVHSQHSCSALRKFLLKLSEERAAWRSREHDKIRAILHDMKAELSKEKKTRQRLEMVNSKLLNQLSETKLFAKRYMQESEKERKKTSQENIVLFHGYICNKQCCSLLHWSTPRFVELIQ